jgi:hypothetical protein
VLSKHDSLGVSEENDATEQALDYEISRSFPSPAVPDHPAGLYEFEDAFVARDRAVFYACFFL